MFLLMKKIKFINLAIIIAFISLSFTNLHSQNTKITREQYIEQYKKICIEEMNRVGVPASIKMAQALLESDNGNSTLAKKANNHFGIKCHSNWTGGTFHQDDDTKDECFRKYKKAEESFLDHSDFLKNGKRYSFLFELKSDDYNSWAHGLKKAGYATNPKYPELLIKIIEDNKLYEFDNLKTNNQQLADIDKNIYLSSGNREVFYINKVKCIKVKEGDTFFKISKDLDLMLWQLYKYNELGKDSKLQTGQVLYIQPKRAKAEIGYEEHIVKEGETLYDISQLYGVKLKKLYKKNNLAEGNDVKTGDKIWLRKRKPVN